MLPRDRRLRASAEIGAVGRRGRRAGSLNLVVHAAPSASEQHSRFALAVGKSVGGSVVRHRVARRLRAILASQVGDWDARGLDVVVRALPPAGYASSAELRRDLTRCGAKLDSLGGPE